MVFLHVAINVSDLERAAAFYEGLLGLTPVDRPLKFPGRWYQIGTVQIHLIQAEKVVPPHPDERWGRNPHFALGVSDLAVFEQRLTAAKIPLQRSASGRAAIFVADPDGNLIELSQLF
ncbi:MAG: VOC family protein [Thermosynechococcus sp. Uc]|uniref:VOC family protein n=1 Tax=Thermosynechococcus sp. Uc TaxID=3034853 RepID=UPI001A0B869E|nr:VOC family protein [Thermosynechococcus sp. Uc]MDM7326451.1 VOC family protein [Thermosynechococcus sp. Uc]HIK25750.1 VOC family protein [Thermosynechococcus sp. M46_R2017_013]